MNNDKIRIYLYNNGSSSGYLMYLRYSFTSVNNLVTIYGSDVFSILEKNHLNSDIII